MFIPPIIDEGPDDFRVIVDAFDFFDLQKPRCSSALKKTADLYDDFLFLFHILSHRYTNCAFYIKALLNTIYENNP